MKKRVAESDLLLRVENAGLAGGEYGAPGTSGRGLRYRYGDDEVDASEAQDEEPIRDELAATWARPAAGGSGLRPVYGPP